MTRPYDIIIWGASGFTGRLALDYLYAQHGIDNVKWAVAGRNENKLRQVLAGRDVPILLADANDPESLSQLVKNTRVMLTTVGPYARYGSLLVAACAEYGTHYCDIT
ncbi:MAG TPA: saccharopine dehydrogenase, partial [Gammaproteobacteria bacterium]|nr:saccharopine dehydrogenase [Gammaproteobacteria bacterium]